MTTEVLLPKTGMGIEEGTISRWLKSVGDMVAKGEPLVEIETAKAIEEVTAPVAGRLSQILLGNGETGPVSSTIALIEEGGA
jgi:pyruvate/2-oxoglutarate dehydrogenase complex dihydrolipoamide acyltransferase (E2) component